MRLAVVLLGALLLAACGGGDDDAAPTATPAQDAEGTGAADGISIPSISVDAPLTPRQLVAGAPLPSPDGPYDVALYDFGREMAGLGGAPGEGGNVVLAGESLAFQGCAGAAPPCEGVFWPLQAAGAGAAIDLTWQGSVYRYQIVSMCNVPTSAFGDGLYRRTAEEQLTLLTGGGQWSSASGWSHVLVVIAKPAPRTAIEPCPEGTLAGRP